MRLLNTRSMELALFASDAHRPTYAALSHTWEDNEVAYQDMLSSSKGTLGQGLSKIRHACEQAVRDNIEWIWIDTCCIDKTSSAELAEAINSMFQWYKRSVVCYAYLSDVHDVSEIQSSRWFTRGWTLQELLAPTAVRFYSKNWSPLGSRDDLSRQITEATGIEHEFLQGRDLRFASVAKRMSWSSLRATTRTEDLAYCLLGIFDVNMPLLYGEGEKAFLRLQEEILKSTADYSLFAWGSYLLWAHGSNAPTGGAH
ncbi:HET-domain-containing protein [Thozetella sp. PMI_491]|nr:HET-domain-containing protein [Thozetella sp. PMI_491]